MNNRRLLYTILIFVLLITSITVQAQHVLSGVVLNRSGHTPVVGAELFHERNGAVIRTSQDGSFTIEDLEPGEHSFTFFSYAHQTQSVVVNLQQDTTIEVYADSIAIELSDVVVMDKRVEHFALKRLNDVEGTSIYAGKKSEVVLLDLAMGNLATNNSRQIYAQVAGLNIYEGSDGGLQLNIGGRGLDPNRTSSFNTRQNGYDISADVLGYPESYYTPPSEALEQVEIVRGAASLQYGTQFGGMINFKIKKLPTFQKWAANVRQTIGSFGMYNGFYSLGWNPGKWRINTYYNHKNGDGYRPNSNYEARHAFLSVGYDFNTRTSLDGELTHFYSLAKQAGGLTDFQFNENPRQSTRTRNWFEVNWLLYNLKLSHQLTDNDRITVSFFGLDARRNALGFRGNPLDANANPITALDEQNVDGDFIYPRDLIQGDFNNWGVETKYLKEYEPFGRRALLLVGAKYYHAQNTAIQGAGSTGIGPDFNFYNDRHTNYPNQSEFLFPNRNLALFAEHIFYIDDRWSIIPGIRYEMISTKSEGDYRQVVFDNAGNPIQNQQLEDNRHFERAFALAGLGVNYKLGDHTQWYANISQNYRSVTFSDIRVVNPSFIVDPDIGDERGYTLDIGMRGRAKEYLSYELGGYHIRYQDRIGIIFDDRANRVRKNIGDAGIWGIESLFDINFDKLWFPAESQYRFNAFVNAAFTHSEYHESESNNVTGKKVEFIPTYNIKSGIRAGYHNLLLGLQFSHLSEQFTDAQNSEAAQEGDSRSGIIGSIPAYSILDFSLSYKWKNWKFETGINNLLDEAYFTRRATGYPGPGIIPSEGRAFYITVGYNWESR